MLNWRALKICSAGGVADVSGVDWQALGTAIAGLAVGAGGVGLWWRQQIVSNARQGAEVNVIELMRDEMSRLQARMLRAEHREMRLIRHIYQLEALMRVQGMTPPTFDIDSHTISASGDSA